MKNAGKKTKLTPKLRFPEFRDGPDWDPTILARTIDLISGLHLSPDQYSSTGTIPYFTGPSDFTNTLQAVTKWTEQAANLAEEGDTLITVKGSGVGEIWYLTLPSVALGRQLMAVRTKHGSSRFMFQFLLTKRTRFEDLASGNLIPGLSRPDILDLAANLPSPQEQERIAECLNSLDAQIGAENQKLDALKAHKKGLMQQLFPREGETVPRHRFPEFRDAPKWEVKNVGSFAKITTGGKDTQDKAARGRYPFFVRSQTVERIDSYSFDGEAVLTSGDGVGVGRNYHYILGRFDFHQRVYCVCDFADYVSGYFFYLYFSEHFGERVMRMSAKNSVDSVRMPMIFEMPISLPSFPEQRRIGATVRALDDLISAQHDKVEALKIHKTGLMQQLFPSATATDA